MPTAVPYRIIKAARQAAIKAGAHITPKGRCHMCDWPLKDDALYCSNPCTEDYMVEQIELQLGAPCRLSIA